MRLTRLPVVGLCSIDPTGWVPVFLPENHPARVSPFPGEVLFFALPKKSNQKKGGPGGLPAARVPCASRHFERSPNSQDLLRLPACKSNSNRAARSIPECLRCSAAPDGRTFLWACGSRRRDNAVSRLQSVYALQCAPTRQPVELYTRLAQPSIAGKTGSSSRSV
jgi:hypothetical protein